MPPFFFVQYTNKHRKKKKKKTTYNTPQKSPKKPTHVSYTQPYSQFANPSTHNIPPRHSATNTWQTTTNPFPKSEVATTTPPHPSRVLERVRWSMCGCVRISSPDMPLGARRCRSRLLRASWGGARWGNWSRIRRWRGAWRWRGRRCRPLLEKKKD